MCIRDRATGIVLSTYSNGMYSFLCVCAFVGGGVLEGGGGDLPTANENGRVLSGTGVSSHSTEEKVVI